MSTFVLVRPGCTDFDEQCRIQGGLDLPLNRRGKGQVQGITESLRDMELAAVYTSPSNPARCTAEVIGDSLGVPVKEKEDLRNLDQGLWEGLPVDEIRRKFPKVFKQWQEAPETICPPEGETIGEALERIRKVLQKPLKKSKIIAVVASEPLATLVSCMMRGHKLEFTDTIGSPQERLLVEIIETNGQAQLNGNGQQPAKELD